MNQVEHHSLFGKILLDERQIFENMKNLVVLRFYAQYKPVALELIKMGGVSSAFKFAKNPRRIMNEIFEGGLKEYEKMILSLPVNTHGYFCKLLIKLMMKVFQKEQK